MSKQIRGKAKDSEDRAVIPPRSCYNAAAFLSPGVIVGTNYCCRRKKKIRKKIFT